MREEERDREDAIRKGAEGSPRRREEASNILPQSRATISHSQPVAARSAVTEGSFRFRGFTCPVRQ